MITTAAICNAIQWPQRRLLVRLNQVATRCIDPSGLFLHYHTNMLEIHIIRSGKGRYLIDQKFLPYQSYTAIVVQPMHQHRFFYEPGTWLHRMILFVDRTMFFGRRADLVARKLPEWIKLNSIDINILEMQYRLIENEISRPSADSRIILRNELENIVLLLQKAGREKGIKSFSDLRLLNVIDFIEKNYAAKTSLKRLGMIARMSPIYLSHRFKQQIGIGLKQYILQRRIAAARVCLESDKDVKMIVLAEQLGFSDLSSFYRCFRSYTGIAPAAYSKIYHKQSNIYQRQAHLRALV